MTQAKVRFTSIEEYAALTTSELPECRFELVDGVIVEMGAENDQNNEIGMFLAIWLAQFVSGYLLRRGTEIQVDSAFVTCREPDLLVLTEATRNAMRRDKRSIVTKTMPVPALVVEVVSPGEPGSENYDRDYLHKRSEYAARGIPEYWLIDPIRRWVRVLQLTDGQYQETTFTGNMPVISDRFPNLELTVEQMLSAGIDE